MATAPAQSVALDVGEVRPGLYIRALDRPWVETPFVFQGFRVVGEAEIDALRRYCSHVYVDLGRSEPEAAEGVVRSGRRVTTNADAGTDDQPTQGRSSWWGDAAGVPNSPLFIKDAYPDRELFRPRVAIAAKHRDRVQRTLKDAMQRVRNRRVIDVKGSQQAVGRLAQLISDDPTASLWLTQMRSQDDYTTTHSVNACVLAMAFGHYLGLEGDALRNLGMGTLLMDVGRTTVPNAVLAKQRGLSETEWAYVKRHVTAGVRLLEPSGVPQEALDVVKMHHERIRGNGYPKGCSGDKIPFAALIAGLADSYDAMLRRRPHRGPYKPADALTHLYDQAHVSFGQDLVESFIRYLGTYPVGSVVELDNGTIGVVVGNRPGAGLWPTVLLVRDERREPFQKRVLLNLAEANQSGRTEQPPRSVRGTLTQRDAKVSVGKVAAVEFGMGETA